MERNEIQMTVKRKILAWKWDCWWKLDRCGTFLLPKRTSLIHDNCFRRFSSAQLPWNATETNRPGFESLLSWSNLHFDEGEESELRLRPSDDSTKRFWFRNSSQLDEESPSRRFGRCSSRGKIPFTDKLLWHDGRLAASYYNRCPGFVSSHNNIYIFVLTPPIYNQNSEANNTDHRVT